MMKHSYTLNLLSRIVSADTKLKGIATQFAVVPRRFFNEYTEKIAEQASEAPKKAPLFDLHGRRHDYLRISLTERCNLRCQYCMPAEGVPLCPRSELMTREELFRAVRVMAAAGVTKLRLTGGEPTLRADLPDIIQELNSIPGIQSVSMTTNALVLTRKLPALQRAGLAAINISLDSLKPERYEKMARRPGLSRVLAAIDLALQLGYKPLKINTVLMKGFNDDEILDFVEFTREREVEVRFIEFMPFSGNRWDDSMMVPYKEALRKVKEHLPDLTQKPLAANHTARVWSAPGYAGSVGFISSMTDHFCGSCNRMRLTADGGLKVCLFGRDEMSLRDAIRGGVTDEELLTLVRVALEKKRPKHAARGTSRDAAKVTNHRASNLQLHAQVDEWTNQWSYLPLPSKVANHRASHLPLLHEQVANLRVPYVPLSNCLPSSFKISTRAYSNRATDKKDALTHLDGSGAARMVDVGDKPVTRRIARAECRVMVSGRLIRLLRDASVPKGDALCVARVAGAMGVKRTADLLPLCHPLPLSAANVELRLPRGEGAAAAGGAVTITCEVRVEARTGAEMEALTGCSIAALALYDMCKAVDKNMKITDLHVVHKSGGRSDTRPEPLPEPVPRPRPPHDATAETYAPTNVMNF